MGRRTVRSRHGCRAHRVPDQRRPQRRRDLRPRVPPRPPPPDRPHRPGPSGGLDLRELERLAAGAPTIVERACSSPIPAVPPAVTEAIARRLLQAGRPGHRGARSRPVSLRRHGQPLRCIAGLLAPLPGGQTAMSHAYYEGPTFVSVGGRRLATLVCRELDRASDLGRVACVGRQAPLLKETRMTAVESRIGPPLPGPARPRHRRRARSALVTRGAPRPLEQLTSGAPILDSEAPGDIDHSLSHRLWTKRSAVLDLVG